MMQCASWQALHQLVVCFLEWLTHTHQRVHLQRVNRAACLCIVPRLATGEHGKRYGMTCTNLVYGSRAVPFRYVRKRGVIKLGINLTTVPLDHMWPDCLHRQHAPHHQPLITVNQASVHHCQGEGLRLSEGISCRPE